jgi:hypothetical protein
MRQSLTGGGWKPHAIYPAIAAQSVILCSPKAQHIQGTAIAVDGGSTVGYY